MRIRNKCYISFTFQREQTYRPHRWTNRHARPFDPWRGRWHHFWTGRFAGKMYNIHPLFVRRWTKYWSEECIPVMYQNFFCRNVPFAFFLLPTTIETKILSLEK